jgi:hypothetical protein
MVTLPLDLVVDAPEDKERDPPVIEELAPPATVIPELATELVVAPTEISTEPLAPPDDSPLLMVTDPEEPEEVVPVLKSRAPETPAVPAFDVNKVMLPLDDCVPEPLTNEIEPPVDIVETPPFNNKSPPL